MRESCSTRCVDARIVQGAGRASEDSTDLAARAYCNPCSCTVLLDSEDDVVIHRRKAGVLAVVVLAWLAVPALALEEGMPHNGLSSRSFRLNAVTTNAKA